MTQSPTHSSRSSRLSTRVRRAPLLLLGSALLGGVLLTGCGASGGSPAQSLLAAKVDGHAITVADYNQLVSVYKASATVQGKSSDIQSPAGRQSLATVEHSALDSLIQLQLMDEQLQKQHISVASKDVSAAETQLRAAITQERQTIAKDPKNPQNVAAQSELDVLSPNAIHLLAEQNAAQNALTLHGSVPAVHAHGILVKTQAQAQQLQTQMLHGGDFAALAKQYSLDTQTGATGGDLGTVYAGQLGASFDKAVFVPASIDKQLYLVEPISGQYALFQVTSRTTATLASIGNQQTESQVVQGWVTSVLQPQAHIQQYVTIG